MQTGKKKLVLDHLIVQKMDDDDTAGDDLQSIITFGARALFADGDQSSKDITCVYMIAVTGRMSDSRLSRSRE